MCILSFLPEGIPLDDDGVDSLWNGGISNPDGHGWAIADGDKMIVGKSLRLDEALVEFTEAREKYLGPALFHSRWATHGSVRVGNCHPFLVGKSHQTVLAHNGILPKDAHPKKGDDRSDTAILAEEILPRRWFRLDKPTVQRSMSQWAGSYNKVVILTVNPRYRQNAYIINEAAGEWDNTTGMWHSNGDYLTPYKWKSTQWTSSTGDTYEWSSKDRDWVKSARESADAFIDMGECYFCTQPIDPNGYCTYCGSCEDCMEHERDCLCYMRKRLVQVD